MDSTAEHEWLEKEWSDVSGSEDMQGAVRDMVGEDMIGHRPSADLLRINFDPYQSHGAQIRLLIFATNCQVPIACRSGGGVGCSE